MHIGKTELQSDCSVGIIEATSALSDLCSQTVHESSPAYHIQQNCYPCRRDAHVWRTLCTSFFKIWLKKIQETCKGNLRLKLSAKSVNSPTRFQLQIGFFKAETRPFPHLNGTFLTTSIEIHSGYDGGAVLFQTRGRASRFVYLFFLWFFTFLIEKKPRTTLANAFREKTVANIHLT